MAYGGRQWPTSVKVSKFSGVMVSTFFHSEVIFSRIWDHWIEL